MSNHLKKLIVLTSLALFSSQLSADYTISINVGGEEYYSSENGSNNPNVVSVQNDGSLSVQRSAARPSGGQANSRKPRYRVKHNKGKKTYDRLVVEAANKHRVDPDLVHAVIQAESAYNERAISSAGAVGLMQLMPATARRFGVYDRTDPYQNIDGGTRYLRHLLDLFDYKLDLTLAAYNAGENAVIKHNHSIPPYRETQQYVKQILTAENNNNAGNNRSKSKRRRTSPFVGWSDSDYQ